MQSTHNKNMTSTTADIQRRCAESAANFSALGEHAETIAKAGQLLIQSLQGGGKIIFCGNGGSAADSQHLAAELMGRFLRDRTPLAAMALTTDTSALTAIANDYGYEFVFERQLRGVGRAGDTLVAISTSGNSANVITAARAAQAMGIGVVAMTGANGGELAEICDLLLNAPAKRTDQIQELHIAIGHMLCGIVEDALCPED